MTRDDRDAVVDRYRNVESVQSTTGLISVIVNKKRSGNHFLLVFLNRL